MHTSLWNPKKVVHDDMYSCAYTDILIKLNDIDLYQIFTDSSKYITKLTLAT